MLDVVNGQPRVMGTAKTKPVFIELLGRPENLNRVTMIVSAPKDSPSTIATNADYRYMKEFLRIAAPDWPSGLDWLNVHLQGIAVSKGAQAKTGRYEITLIGGNGLNMAALNIRAIHSTSDIPNSWEYPQFLMPLICWMS
jgi:hypothetical protein